MFEGGGHFGEHGVVGEDVSLNRKVGFIEMAGPRKAFVPGMGCGLSGGVDDGELSAFAIGVGGGECLDAVPGRDAVFQKIESIDTVGNIRKRLGGDGADSGPCPGNDTADTKVFARDGDAEVAGRGVASDDGKGCDDWLRGAAGHGVYSIPARKKENCARDAGDAK